MPCSSTVSEQKFCLFSVRLTSRSILPMPGTKGLYSGRLPSFSGDCPCFFAFGKNIKKDLREYLLVRSHPPALSQKIHWPSCGTTSAASGKTLPPQREGIKKVRSSPQCGSIGTSNNIKLEVPHMMFLQENPIVGNIYDFFRYV